MTVPWLSPPTGGLTTWERAWPKRLGEEIAQLSLHGRIVQIQRHSEIDVLVVFYDWRHGDVIRSLVVIFNRGFPFVRPEVRLLADPSTYPRRHCDPFTGAICYLGHTKHEWGPRHLIADLIQSQLPRIFDGTAEEDRIGEPAENWWNQWNLVTRQQDDASLFLVDSAWDPGTDCGGCIDLVATFGGGQIPLMRCLVERVRGAGGKQLAGGTITPPSEFLDGRRLQIPWVRFDEELFPRKDDKLFDSVVDRAGAAVRPVKIRGGLFAKLVVAVFPTEITHGRSGFSWVLFMQSGGARALGVDGKLPKGSFDRSIVKTFRAGAGDLRSRAPSAAALEGRAAAVIGIGAIGGPVAIELARGGVAAITMLDDDIVKPGNGVRWPLGATGWGRPKVEVLASHISQNYPQVSVKAIRRKIGDIDFGASVGDDAEAAKGISGADLLIDASAEFGVTQIMAGHADRARKNLVAVSATPDVAGGAVAVFVPGGACPACLVRHQLDGTIPSPPGENGDPFAVRLPGCAEATFAGSSFDLSELSLEAVRVGVRTLTAQPQRSFVETLSFVGEDLLPSWQSDGFDPHPECTCR